MDESQVLKCIAKKFEHRLEIIQKIVLKSRTTDNDGYETRVYIINDLYEITIKGRASNYPFWGTTTKCLEFKKL